MRHLLLLATLLFTTLAWARPSDHALQVTANGEPFCQGVLIAKDVALTAAHCDAPAHPLRASKFNGVPVKEVVRTSRAIDIAVVRLAKPPPGHIAEFAAPLPSDYKRGLLDRRKRRSKGDSGSPIFRDGKLAAILSGFDGRDRYLAWGANVSNPAIRKWIDAALE